MDRIPRCPFIYSKFKKLFISAWTVTLVPISVPSGYFRVQNDISFENFIQKIDVSGKNQNFILTLIILNNVLFYYFTICINYSIINKVSLINI
jgi:hypothetical protein